MRPASLLPGWVIMLLLVGCSTSNPAASVVPRDAHRGATRLVASLPEYRISPAATTRPSLVGRVSFVTPPAIGVDRFHYAFVMTDADEMVVHRTGGFAGTSKWFGPVPDDRLGEVLRISIQSLSEVEQRHGER